MFPLVILCSIQCSFVYVCVCVCIYVWMYLYIIDRTSKMKIDIYIGHIWFVLLWAGAAAAFVVVVVWWFFDKTSLISVLYALKRFIDCLEMVAMIAGSQLPFVSLEESVAVWGDELPSSKDKKIEYKRKIDQLIWIKCHRRPV